MIRTCSRYRPVARFEGLGLKYIFMEKWFYFMYLQNKLWRHFGGTTQFGGTAPKCPRGNGPATTYAALTNNSIISFLPLLHLNQNVVCSNCGAVHEFQNAIDDDAGNIDLIFVHQDPARVSGLVHPFHGLNFSFYCHCVRILIQQK